MAKTAKLTGVLGLNSSLFEAGLKKATGSAQKFAGNLSGKILKEAVTGPLGAIGAAIGAAFAFKSFVGGIQGAITSGAAMKTLSEQTGVAVGSLKTLGYAFKEAYVDTDLLVPAIGKMQNTLFQAASGSQSARSALDLMGLKLKDIIKLSPEEQFQKIGESINRFSDATSRAGAAVSIFSREGKQLLPVFQNLENLNFNELHESAQVLQENAAAFREIAVGFNRAFGSLKGIYLGIAAGLVDPLLDLLHSLPKISFVSIGKNIGEALSKAYFFVKGFVTNFQMSMQLTGSLLFELAETVKDAWVGVARDISNALSDAFADAVTNIEGSIKDLLSSFKGTSILDSIIGMPVDTLIKQLQTASSTKKHTYRTDTFSKASEQFSQAVKDFRWVTAMIQWSGGKANREAVQAKKVVGLVATPANGGLKSGGLTTGVLGPGLGPLWGKAGVDARDKLKATPLGSSGALQGGGRNPTPLIRRGEILDAQNAQVAAGQAARDNHLVRRGDHSRAREYQRSEAKKALGLETGVEKTNTLLDQIKGMLEPALQ